MPRSCSLAGRAYSNGGLDKHAHAHLASPFLHNYLIVLVENAYATDYGEDGELSQSADTGMSIAHNFIFIMHLQCSSRGLGKSGVFSEEPINP